MFTYSGWNAAAYVAEEVRDPGRNVPLRARRSAPSPSSSIYLLAERAVSLRACRSASSRRASGSVLDVVAERLFGVRGRQHHGRGLDRQPGGEHQRDDVRRPARVLRDGARRPVLPAGGARPPALQDARRVAIVAQAMWSDRARAVRHALAARRATRDSRSCCSPGSPSPRCSCCGARAGGAAAVQRVGISRGRRPSSSSRRASSWCNALWNDLARADHERHELGPVSRRPHRDRARDSRVLPLRRKHS